MFLWYLTHQHDLPLLRSCSSIFLTSFVCAISRLRSLNNAVAMLIPRSISRLRRNENLISRATYPTFTTLLLLGFNNRINRPVDGRLLNQLKTHLVQPSKTYATTIRPTDRPSFHFWASLVELYGVQLPRSIVAYLGNWKYGINGRPSREESAARIRKNRHCLQRSLNQYVFSSFFRLFTPKLPTLAST